MNLQTVNLKLDMVTFEHASVIDPGNNVQYIVVCRPPPSTENGFRLSTFLHEFDIFIGEIALMPGKVILAGDFNMHVDVPSKSDVKRFLTSIETSGFQQHVISPTHKDGHILDLVMSRVDNDIVKSCNVLHERLSSDHHMIQCVINHGKPKLTKKTVKVCNFRGIDYDQFKTDVTLAFLANAFLMLY